MSVEALLQDYTFWRHELGYVINTREMKRISAILSRIERKLQEYGVSVD